MVMELTGLEGWIVRNILPSGVLPALVFDPEKSAVAVARFSDGGEEALRLVNGHLAGKVCAPAAKKDSIGPTLWDGIAIGTYFGGRRTNFTVWTFGLDCDKPNATEVMSKAQKVASDAKIDLTWLVKADGSGKWHAHGRFLEPYDSFRAKMYLWEVFKDFKPGDVAKREIEVFPKEAETKTAAVGNYMKLGFSAYSPYFPVGWKSWDETPLDDIKLTTIPADFTPLLMFKSAVPVLGVGTTETHGSNKTHDTPLTEQELSTFRADLTFHGFANDARRSDGPRNHNVYKLANDYALSYDQAKELFGSFLPDMNFPTKERWDARMANWRSAEKYPRGWKRGYIAPKPHDAHWFLKVGGKAWRGGRGMGYKTLGIFTSMVTFADSKGVMAEDGEWSQPVSIPASSILADENLQGAGLYEYIWRLQVLGCIKVKTESVKGARARTYLLRLPSENQEDTICQRIKEYKSWFITRPKSVENFKNLVETLDWSLPWI